MSVNEMLMAAAGASGPSEYVEDVFSTYLYTGTGLNVNNTITNGIDLAGEGGLVWTKNRSGGNSHVLCTTDLGFSNYLASEQTWSLSQFGSLVTMTANSNGYTLNDTNGSWNDSGQTFASWTFRKAPKFFDVVTWTGDGANRTIAHNLGSVPGMIIVKRTDTTGSWFVYHRGTNGGTNPQNFYTLLNDSLDQTTSSGAWNNTAPTSTVFSVGTTSSVNANGGTFVAYLFAHDAGGFGAAGTDNVISCGSFTTDGSGNATVSLGYEPQYILYKETSGANDWFVFDVMRGWSNTNGQVLIPNTSGAEANYGFVGAPNATGFNVTGFNASATYIYMAIRRPMKKPTSGTEVFAPIVTGGSDVTGTVKTTGFPIDLQIQHYRLGGVSTSPRFVDRLRGVSTSTTETGRYLLSSSTGAEVSTSNTSRFWNNTGFQQPSAWDGSEVSYSNFRRATGFFDIVCYTGTGSATTVTHNLGTVPELMIVKRRNSTGGWQVYSAELAANGILVLNSTAAATTSTPPFNATRPTSSVFSVGTSSLTNASGGTYVAYLFDSVAGVSKIGTYTGNGTNQTINCGFSAGARFVLIKRTDSTGDWCVFDTARGITSTDDPFLTLNTTAAEYAVNDSLDPANSGFIVNEDAASNLNVNGATYIYLAIA